MVSLSRKIIQIARSKLKGSSDPELKELCLKSDLTKKQRAKAFSKRENRRSANAENVNGTADEGDVGVGNHFLLPSPSNVLNLQQNDLNTF